jgi:hypothetical protein
MSTATVEPTEKRIRLGKDGLPKLTGKQANFVRFYLGRAKFNGTLAAKLAHYKAPTVSASQLLTIPNVKAHIDARIAKLNMESGELLARLNDEASADYTQLARCYIQQGERRILDWRKVRRLGLGHLIKKVTPTKWGDSVELYDSQRAKELIGKSRGLWIERHQHSVLGPLEHYDDEQLARIARGEEPGPPRLAQGQAKALETISADPTPCEAESAGDIQIEARADLGD